MTQENNNLIAGVTEVLIKNGWTNLPKSYPHLHTNPQKEKRTKKEKYTTTITSSILG